jgi:hypothetical protein
MWPNAVWACSVSALRWVPLSVYAADGKLAAYSKGHEVQWVWGIVRWRRRDFIRSRYRRRRFSTSLQIIWLTRDIHWPMNEAAPIDHFPYASMLRNHKVRLTAWIDRAQPRSIRCWTSPAPLGPFKTGERSGLF